MSLYSRVVRERIDEDMYKNEISFYFVPFFLSAYVCKYLGALIVQWILLWEMDTTNRVQNLDEAFCFSHWSNTLGKGKNATILPPTMDKEEGRLSYLSLV